MKPPERVLDRTSMVCLHERPWYASLGKLLLMVGLHEKTALVAENRRLDNYQTLNLCLSEFHRNSFLQKSQKVFPIGVLRERFGKVGQPGFVYETHPECNLFWTSDFQPLTFLDGLDVMSRLY